MADDRPRVLWLAAGLMAGDWLRVLWLAAGLMTTKLILAHASRQHMASRFFGAKTGAEPKFKSKSKFKFATCPARHKTRAGLKSKNLALS